MSLEFFSPKGISSKPPVFLYEIIRFIRKYFPEGRFGLEDLKEKLKLYTSRINPTKAQIQSHLDSLISSSVIQKINRNSFNTLPIFDKLRDIPVDLFWAIMRDREHFSAKHDVQVLLPLLNIDDEQIITTVPEQLQAYSLNRGMDSSNPSLLRPGPLHIQDLDFEIEMQGYIENKEVELLEYMISKFEENTGKYILHSSFASGKSSFLRYLANKFDQSVFIINYSEYKGFESILANLDEGELNSLNGSLLIIEDVTNVELSIPSITKTIENDGEEKKQTFPRFHTILALRGDIPHEGGIRLNTTKIIKAKAEQILKKLNKITGSHHKMEVLANRIAELSKGDFWVFQYIIRGVIGGRDIEMNPIYPSDEVNKKEMNRFYDMDPEQQEMAVSIFIKEHFLKNLNECAEKITVSISEVFEIQAMVLQSFDTVGHMKFSWLHQKEARKIIEFLSQRGHCKILDDKILPLHAARTKLLDKTVHYAMLRDTHKELLGELDALSKLKNLLVNEYMVNPHSTEYYLKLWFKNKQKIPEVFKSKLIEECSISILLSDAELVSELKKQFIDVFAIRIDAWLVELFQKINAVKHLEIIIKLSSSSSELLEIFKNSLKNVLPSIPVNKIYVLANILTKIIPEEAYKLLHENKIQQHRSRRSKDSSPSPQIIERLKIDELKSFRKSYQKNDLQDLIRKYNPDLWEKISEQFSAKVKERNDFLNFKNEESKNLLFDDAKWVDVFFDRYLFPYFKELDESYIIDTELFYNEFQSWDEKQQRKFLKNDYRGILYHTENRMGSFDLDDFLSRFSNNELELFVPILFSYHSATVDNYLGTKNVLSYIEKYDVKGLLETNSDVKFEKGREGYQTTNDMQQMYEDGLFEPYTYGMLPEHVSNFSDKIKKIIHEFNYKQLKDWLERLIKNTVNAIKLRDSQQFQEAYGRDKVPLNLVQQKEIILLKNRLDFLGEVFYKSYKDWVELIQKSPRIVSWKIIEELYLNSPSILITLLPILLKVGGSTENKARQRIQKLKSMDPRLLISHWSLRINPLKLKELYEILDIHSFPFTFGLELLKSIPLKRTDYTGSILWIQKHYNDKLKQNVGELFEERILYYLLGGGIVHGFNNIQYLKEDIIKKKILDYFENVRSDKNSRVNIATLPDIYQQWVANTLYSELEKGINNLDLVDINFLLKKKSIPLLNILKYYQHTQNTNIFSFFRRYPEHVIIPEKMSYIEFQQLILLLPMNDYYISNIFIDFIEMHDFSKIIREYTLIEVYSILATRPFGTIKLREEDWTYIQNHSPVLEDWMQEYFRGYP